MLNPDSIMFRAPNEKYREEYSRIFKKPSVPMVFTTDELTNDIPSGDGDLSGGMLSRD